jgi:hypothetical protein
MSSLFGGKSREERESEKQQKQAQLQHAQKNAADRFDAMVTKSLEQLTRWAFPDSQVEHPEVAKWQLWHTTDEGEKYVDVAVELDFDDDEPSLFICSESSCITEAELTCEDLNEGLRVCICSQP